ncbi:MAG: hypothetical protein HON68_00365 [Gammaproteobacteria bacterium]|nr:hypothetical protein [Gammaproteobacteria bacterium]MBT3489253.1 hypothetical protein [Gammaproteobacteria bacterium]MBT3717791.1 hypothetical protein [Gammaproteobacteria bacterium]MBT3843601.1 hypothetical protein [Gammaproteobacteria bacterium]MBT3894037.1 hypothetical protein [Gammaproteobacteria bacterium]
MGEPSVVKEDQTEPLAALKRGHRDDGLNAVSQLMAEQLSENQNFSNRSNPRIAVTSFVSIHNYNQSDAIGETLADNMIHEMQVRGYSVIDFKSMPAIRVTDDGDFIRSRSVNALRKKQNIDLVLSGTYTKQNNGLHINARIIQVESGLVVSTAQGFISRSTATSILGEEMNFSILNDDSAFHAILREDHTSIASAKAEDNPAILPEITPASATLKESSQKKLGCFANGICIQSR